MRSTMKVTRRRVTLIRYNYSFLKISNKSMSFLIWVMLDFNRFTIMFFFSFICQKKALWKVDTVNTENGIHNENTSVGRPSMTGGTTPTGNKRNIEDGGICLPGTQCILARIQALNAQSKSQSSIKTSKTLITKATSREDKQLTLKRVRIYSWELNNFLVIYIMEEGTFHWFYQRRSRLSY